MRTFGADLGDEVENAAHRITGDLAHRLAVRARIGRRGQSGGRVRAHRRAHASRGVRVAPRSTPRRVSR